MFFYQNETAKTANSKQIRLHQDVVARLNSFSEGDRQEMNNLAGGLVDLLEPISLEIQERGGLDESTAREIALFELKAYELELRKTLVSNALQRRRLVPLSSSEPAAKVSFTSDPNELEEPAESQAETSENNWDDLDLDDV